MKAFFLSLGQNDILRLALDSAFKLVLAAVAADSSAMKGSIPIAPPGFARIFL